MAREGAEGPEFPERNVEIDAHSVILPGVLVLPRNARGVVIFAHGSGSSRLSPRNTYVARTLHRSGFGTLLFDLLTGKEDQVYDNRFDIDLLADRLTGATEWLREQKETAHAGLAYFGASTGAAAALEASVRLPGIKAIVSRGGRPDLAWDHLGRVTSPTLLIVGELDGEVIELNRRAFDRLNLNGDLKEVVIIPGATHLFEEPGALEEVARAANDWFRRFLGRS